MPVARQKHTKARRDRARVHLEMKTVKTVACSNCSSQVLPHAVCPKCGYYKGKEVVNTMKKAEKKAKKK
jgi:large subunit ribosomal protein L32